MEELLNLQKKYNITDKDLYVLSKLEDDKKKSSFLEKEKLGAMQRSIISKYKIGFTDKVNVFKTLKKSTFHNDLEIIEKYKDSESDKELDEAGKKGKFSFVAGILIFFVIVIVFSLNNNNNKRNSVDNELPISNTSDQPCEDMDSYNQGKREGRGQRGILIDCDSYYPYEGWANNKDCYCEGFNEGQNE